MHPAMIFMHYRILSNHNLTCNSFHAQDFLPMYKPEINLEQINIHHRSPLK